MTDFPSGATGGSGSYDSIACISGTCSPRALNLAPDIILEQTEYVYKDGIDRTSLVTQASRVHDITTTGVLGTSNSVAMFTGFVYDDAERLIRTVGFGTNDTDVLNRARPRPQR